MTFDVNFQRAYGAPLAEADFRTHHEDFLVDEHLGFEPEGVGEHQYVQILKRGENSPWVAGKIARFAGVKDMDVGYCGLKDRHAVTTQWFSVYMPKRDLLDWGRLAETDNLNIQILQSGKGQKKLRRGQHAHNHFVITLRKFTVDPERLGERLRAIAANGVPNYFGEQRFGRDANNLVGVSRWLDEGVPIQKCGPKAMLMSAARSYLFNLVLAERVKQKLWNGSVEGDSLNQDGEPTGPLWGRGRSSTTGEALALELAAYAPIHGWINGLEHCGLQQERRSFVLKPQDFSWTYDEPDRRLTVQFALAPGQYATSILREIALLKSSEEDRSSISE